MPTSEQIPNPITIQSKSNWSSEPTLCLISVDSWGTRNASDRVILDPDTGEVKFADNAASRAAKAARK